MFEYNADTPTSLLEAAVVQWQWLEQIEGLAHRDQFNWIHEELLNRFQFIQQQTGLNDFHFSAMQEAGREDWGNIDYLADVAYNAVGIFISSLLKMWATIKTVNNSSI